MQTDYRRVSTVLSSREQVQFYGSNQEKIRIKAYQESNFPQIGRGFITDYTTLNTLVDSSLKAHWKFDEASGQRNDSKSTNHLTDNNTVTQVAGKLGNAAQFTAANSEYLSIADNAALSHGDFDFTWAGWVYLDNLTAVRTFLEKRPAAGAAQDIEFRINYENTPNRFRTYIGNASSFTSRLADSFGNVPATTWCFIVAWHNSVADTLNIQVNNGPVDSVAWAGGSYNSTGPLEFGRQTNGAAYHNGRLDSWSRWNRVLTADERAYLYNLGNGIEYPF